MSFSIYTKLVFGMTFALFAMAIVGWRGVVGMNDINQNLNAINVDQFIPRKYILVGRSQKYMKNLAPTAGNRA